MTKNTGLKHFDHPLHPMFTHFPMALWMTSLLWDLLGLWSGDQLWWSFSFWSIAVGLLFAFLALVTGLVDFVKVPKGAAENIAFRHLLVMILAAILYAANLFIRYGSTVPTGGRLIIALLLSVSGFLLLIVGGWHGGELVYQYNVGRKAAESQDSK